MRTVAVSKIVCQGLSNWQLLANAIKRQSAKASFPQTEECLIRRDREQHFAARTLRRMSRKARKVIDMPAVADRKAQEMLAPIVVKFRNEDEVKYLRTAVEGMQRESNARFIDTVKNGNRDEQMKALEDRDKVASFTGTILRQLDRKIAK